MSIPITGFACYFTQSYLQNLGRFGETKLNKVIFFCCFSVVLSVSTSGYLAELTATEKQLVLSQVWLEFRHDGEIGPLVHHDLFLWKKHTLG